MIYNQALAMTTSDTVNLAKPTDALLVGSSGVVQAVFENDAVVALTVTGPIVLPLRVKRVNATSTTATGLAALYTV
ncbi:MAG: hypothetical protein ABWY20_23100 [Mycobacterium sp.]